jgi:sterol desaturase/sphingolipid hydroxylase (fatty acid hydroxylase superfamily)
MKTITLIITIGYIIGIIVQFASVMLLNIYGIPIGIVLLFASKNLSKVKGWNDPWLYVHMVLAGSGLTLSFFLIFIVGWKM